MSNKQSIERSQWPKTIRAGAVRARIYRTKSSRHKSGWIYQVGWHDGSCRKLKGFGDAKDAELFAQQITGDIQSGRATSGMSRDDMDTLSTLRSIAGDTDPIQAMREWFRCRDLTKGNLLDACQQWAKANAATYRKVPLADAIEEFRVAKIAQGVDFRKSYANRLTVLTEAFPGQPITAITTAALNRYLQKIPHPVSRNTHRRCIVTLFTWCRKQGWLPDATRTAADNTDRAQERDDTQVGIITPATATELLRAIYSEHRHYLAPLVLALFTGMRRNEVHAQKWDDVDLVEGRLTVTCAKPRTPADRLVEMPDTAIKWLMLCEDRTGNLCGNLAIDRIRDIGRTAGLDLPVNCFRHSAITFRMAIGKTAGVVAAYAGTSEGQIHRHYRRPRPEVEGAAWFALSPDVVLRPGNNIIPMEA